MISRLINRITAWIQGLPRAWVVAGASFVGVIVVVGSVGMYRVYDYVQHDNDFCMSCHLMSGPFDRFQQSAHRGLGCKACHRPNIIQRSKMGLTQILEMPDSISHHAEVPKEICGECHVRGNPNEWKLIANSVGHRVHLESKDPSLRKIECVDCHGAGIHEFAPADKTCGQMGCHEGVAVKLGKMGNGNLTIHCASCHDFTKPVAQNLKTDSLKRQLTPRGADCFSCHAMRKRVGEFPDDEPHGAVCGSCHNPHEQKTPAEAVRSCTNAGCHERVDTISPMHRKLASGVVQNCTTCHKAHTWKAKADACTSCHSIDHLDAQGGMGLKPSVGATTSHMSVIDVALFPTRAVLAVFNSLARQNPGFRHTPHRKLACTSCHENDQGHGVLKIRTAADCSGCHHSQANQARCTACHTAKDLGTTFQRKVTSKTSVSGEVTRTLGFNHSNHTRLRCNSCHTNTAAMRNVPSCTSCHEDHHTELRSCTACHQDVKDNGAHGRKVHTTCAGSGCHQNTVTSTLRTQRNVCLACHTDKTRHEPAGDCATCHMIPKSNTNVRAAR